MLQIASPKPLVEMDLEELFLESDRLQAQLDTQLKAALETARRLGEVFLEIKRKAAHGEFRPIVEQYLKEKKMRVSLRSIQRYMGLAQNWHLIEIEIQKGNLEISEVSLSDGMKLLAEVRQKRVQPTEVFEVWKDLASQHDQNPWGTPVRIEQLEAAFFGCAGFEAALEKVIRKYKGVITKMRDGKIGLKFDTEVRVERVSPAQREKLLREIKNEFPDLDKVAIAELESEALSIAQEEGMSLQSLAEGVSKVTGKEIAIPTPNNQKQQQSSSSIPSNSASAYQELLSTTQKLRSRLHEVLADLDRVSEENRQLREELQQLRRVAS